MTAPPNPTFRPIDDYRAGSFFFASADRTLLASGAHAVLSEPDPDELSAKVAKLLVDTEAPVAVGALPFDPAAAPHLVLPHTATWAGPPPGRLGPRWVAPRAGRIEPVPTAAGYQDAVAAALARLSEGELRKVVLARTLRVSAGEPINVRGLLANLVSDNRHGYTFAAGLPPAADGTRRTLVGSTPELLLSRTGLSVTANPLAGTLARDPDPEQDRRNAAALLSSAKDQDEHQVVVRAVVDALRPFCRRLTVAPQPRLVSTPAVWHLSTTVTGELLDPGISALRLACALHPTPAVCGSPTELARATIAELEPFDRGYYSGAVGWCDVAGDGEWVVAIRCAELAGAALTLYSGAGIMPASRPELELAETSAKFRTLLHGMGLDRLD